MLGLCRGRWSEVVLFVRIVMLVAKFGAGGMFFTRLEKVDCMTKAVERMETEVIAE